MKISIITVTYNSTTTIKDTILSVLSQTYQNIEYYIIDGNSSDGTIDIVNSFMEMANGKLHLISEKDNGIYDAMNKGINIVTGDIVGILNSDDYFTSSDVLEKISVEFNDEKIDAVYGDVHFINDNNPNISTRYYSSAIFRPFLLRFGFMPAHPSFYARRNVYEKYGAYSLDYKIIHNRILITKEDVKACRKYGMYTNIFIISLKYIYKIFEFVFK